VSIIITMIMYGKNMIMYGHNRQKINITIHYYCKKDMNYTIIDLILETTIPLTIQNLQAICNSISFFSTFTLVYYPKNLLSLTPTLKEYLNKIWSNPQINTIEANISKIKKFKQNILIWVYNKKVPIISNSLSKSLSRL